MKTLVVCSSTSPHHNTRRIADVLGIALNARIITPEEATADLLGEADRIGFGSGIYWMRFAPALMECVRALPDMSGRDAFVFATSGMPEPPLPRYTKSLARLLEQRGFTVAGTFTCRGVDTWGPFSVVGGVSKGQPGHSDIADARRFAAHLG